jgi:probable rRNA maturation factor
MSLTLVTEACGTELIAPEFLKAVEDTIGKWLTDGHFVVEVQCLDPDGIRFYNRQYRSLDAPTDVLSFPTIFLNQIPVPPAQSPEKPLPLGSILICPQKAVEYGEKVSDLLCHGLLHLLGHDHEVDPEAWRQAEHRLQKGLAAHSVSFTGIPHEH